MTAVEESAARQAGRTRRQREMVQRSVERRATDGTVLGTLHLAPDHFGIEPNMAVLHQVVTAQLAAARSGTQSTRTRAEVAGGGAKPFRQKGTGRSRQGSIRAPHWTGGGIALGPKPRSYRQRTPKKMVRLALQSALSDRAAEGRVVVVDRWDFEEPKTKRAVQALADLGTSGRVLVVLGAEDWIAARSFGNLPEVQVVAADALNAYDVLRNDWVVFTAETVPGGSGDAADEGPGRPVPTGRPGDAAAGSVAADQHAVGAAGAQGSDEEDGQ